MIIIKTWSTSSSSEIEVTQLTQPPILLAHFKDTEIRSFNFPQKLRRALQTKPESSPIFFCFLQKWYFFRIKLDGEFFRKASNLLKSFHFPHSGQVLLWAKLESFPRRTRNGEFTLKSALKQRIVIDSYKFLLSR